MYFGREIGCNDRDVLRSYTLTRRKYIGPTSMDPEIAFLMCNQALVSCADCLFAWAWCWVTVN